MIERDNCQFCLGKKGGVSGNENRINGIIACDHCAVLVHRASAPTPDLGAQGEPVAKGLAQSHYELLRECQVEFRALGCKGLVETIEKQCQRHLAQGGNHEDRS